MAGSAALQGGPLFCRLFFFFMDFQKINFFFYISYWLRLLLIVCGDIESNPDPGFGSSNLIFVVFMPIRTSWLWLDRIMLFWLVLSLKSRSQPSLRAPYPWRWLPQTQGEELHNWCPGYGSLCCGRILIFPAEQVGVFLPRVLYVSYMQ